MRLAGVAVLLGLSLSMAYNISYDNSYSQYKQTSELYNSFSLVQALTDKVDLNLDADFTANRSDALHRFRDTRMGEAWLSYKPGEDLELATSLERRLHTEERFGEITRDEAETTVTGQIRCSALEWLNLDVGLGTHLLRYQTVSDDSMVSGRNQGGVHDVSISVNKSFTPRFSTSVTFGEERTLGDETDYGSDNLTGRVNYKLPELLPDASISYQVGASKFFTTYHDSAQSQRQRSWNHSASFTLPELLPALSVSMGTNWSQTKRYWEREDSTAQQGDARDREDVSRGINSSIRYDIMDNAYINFQISRRLSRSDRKRQGPGTENLFDIWDDSDNRSLSASLVYKPGEAKVEFKRTVELYRHDTFGTWESGIGVEYRDNTDRDELRETLMLDAELPVSSRLTLSTVLTGERRETIYLMAEQSANSKTSSIYSVEPGATFELGRNWDLEHKVEFSADYTTYLFPDVSASNNLLFRRVESSFSLDRLSADSTRLGVSHDFRYQDQGGYEQSMFTRSEESLRSSLTLFGGFHLPGRVGLTPSYSWEYNSRNYPSGLASSTSEHLHHVGLYTNMALSRGNLTLSLTRTFYSEEDRESYWRATVSFNYVP